MIEDIRDKINFYRHRTNWHKCPTISRFLCSIGRHDYTYSSVEYHDQGDPEGAILECFYCFQKKRSILSHIRERALDNDQLLRSKLKNTGVIT